jgi:gamma-glutamyltranspeptidase
MAKIADLVYERKQFFVPYNGKIADITHADTNKHYLTLANASGTGAIAGETRKIVAVKLYLDRTTGTGYMHVYPNEGNTIEFIYSWEQSYGFIVIKDGTQRLQYSQTVANDDLDLYCLGYIVEV